MPMTSPLERCRDALETALSLLRSEPAGSTDVGDIRAATAAADAALAAQGEPVAWAQLGMRNGHTYVRMNYEGHLYPPPADVQRNLNLTPLYAAPVAAPVAARPRDDGPHINRWAVREVWFDENGEPGLHRGVDLRDAAPVAQPLTDEQIDAVVRSVQPHLDAGCKAWKELAKQCRYWLEAERAHGIAPKHGHPHE